MLPSFSEMKELLLFSVCLFALLPSPEGSGYSQKCCCPTYHPYGGGHNQYRYGHRGYKDNHHRGYKNDQYRGYRNDQHRGYDDDQHRGYTSDGYKNDQYSQGYDNNVYSTNGEGVTELTLPTNTPAEPASTVMTAPPGL